MKKIITLILFSLFSISLLPAQTVTQSVNPVGKWKFEAPTAPEGYNTGNIIISFAENKYTAAVSLTGSDYIIPGDRTKVENDVVSFILLIEGTEIAINLKSESSTKMTGIALAPDGEIPLTLTRELPQK